MKIDNIIRSTPTTRGKAVRSSTTQPEARAASSSIKDDVQLTATAEKLSQLEDNLSSLEVSDRAKIEAIRQEIAEGRFKVDEEAVAEGLVQDTIANISRHASKHKD